MGRELVRYAMGGDFDDAGYGTDFPAAAIPTRGPVPESDATIVGSDFWNKTTGESSAPYRGFGQDCGEGAASKFPKRAHGVLRNVFWLSDLPVVPLAASTAGRPLDGGGVQFAAHHDRTLLTRLPGRSLVYGRSGGFCAGADFAGSADHVVFQSGSKVTSPGSARRSRFINAYSGTAPPEKPRRRRLRQRSQFLHGQRLRRLAESVVGKNLPEVVFLTNHLFDSDLSIVLDYKQTGTTESHHIIPSLPRHP